MNLGSLSPPSVWETIPNPKTDKTKPHKISGGCSSEVGVELGSCVLQQPAGEAAHVP